jgi:hypothetical protein
MNQKAWNKLKLDLHTIKQHVVGNYPENPLVNDNGQWFFWDETWSVKYGPYSSENSAKCALMNYLEEL